MKPDRLFGIATFGIFLAFVSVYFYNVAVKPQPPTAISYNPYDNGIYATGIIESLQPSGENVNLFPEVAGKVDTVFVKDGQLVKIGDPILAINNSVQREIVEKDDAQAKAALALLAELKAQPRKENLDVSKAQLDFANANLKNVVDQLAKTKKAYTLDPKSISKNALDNAINAVKIAQENLKVAQMQYNLTKAGAWIYDIENQENQYKALIKTYLSDKALLDKFILRSPINGMILRVRAAVGDYVSPQGTYETYTQILGPAVEMGVPGAAFQVRCYVDEILVPKLPDPSKLDAQMFIRGENNKSIPLEFIRIQPYTIPKIQLSDQRQEKVDVRVLPILFKFKRPDDMNMYPGQLVDVFIKGKK